MKYTNIQISCNFRLLPLNCVLKIKALVGNTGAIFLGDATVDAATGYQLAAGAEISLVDLFYKEGDTVDLNKIYIDSAANAEGVSLVYIV